MNNFIFLVPRIHYNYRGLQSSRWRSSAQIIVQQKRCWSWKNKFPRILSKISDNLTSWTQNNLQFDCFHHNHFWGQSSLHYLRLMLAKQGKPVALKWVFPSSLSPRLSWDEQHERAECSAVCSNKTVLPFCSTLAHVILQLLQLYQELIMCSSVFIWSEALVHPFIVLRHRVSANS